MSGGNRVLRRRFTVVFAVYAALVLLLWLALHNTVFSNMRRINSQSLALAKRSLMVTLDEEYSRMRMTSTAIASSSYVQEFLEERDVGTYYEKAETVSSLIANSIYPHMGSDNIATITAEGIVYRFTGSISAEAIREVTEGIISKGAPFYSIARIDKAEYFCLASAVHRRSGAGEVSGYVVTLSNTTRLRRTLTELEGLTGIDAAVVLRESILLSSNPELEGKPVSELERLYGEVVISGVTGTGLRAAAAITADVLNFGERVFLATSLSVLVVLASAIAILYRVLSQKAIDPILEKANSMQIGLLKTQISAHFVVNTIECIESLSSQGRSEQAAVAARNLAWLLRSLHESGDEANIFEQLESIGSYIEIMNIRSQGKFIVDVDADDRLIEYRMPVHVLQPLVENALTHGLGNKTGDCRLTVRASLTPECVVFEVADNGNGLEAAALHALQEMLDTAEDWDYAEYKLRGVALINIQKRLRARYGKPFGLTVGGAIGKGLTVTARLPLIEEN